MSLFLRQQVSRALDYKDFCLYMHVWLIVSENPKFLSFIRTDDFEDVISPEQILSVLIKQLITIALIKVNQDMYCSQDLFQNSVSIFVHVHLSFSLLILTFILLWFNFILFFTLTFIQFRTLSLKLRKWFITNKINLVQCFQFQWHLQFATALCIERSFIGRSSISCQLKKNFTYISFSHESNM